jgi:hypothetical protein
MCVFPRQVGDRTAAAADPEVFFDRIIAPELRAGREVG